MKYLQIDKKLKKVKILLDNISNYDIIKTVKGEKEKMTYKKLRLKKSIKVVLLDIIQLILITRINTYRINDLYNELYFNICFIISIIILEVIKTLVNQD